MQKQQSGFTLIELIIVIVILGILAVTAAPKFIDIQGDATASTMKGVQAALQGGSQLVYAKSAIAGFQKNENEGDGATTDTDQVSIGGNRVETEYGYPDADSMTVSMLQDWVDLDILASGSSNTADWALHDTSTTDGIISITPKGRSVNSAPASGADDTRCHVTYTNAASGGSPTITAETAGC